MKNKQNCTIRNAIALVAVLIMGSFTARAACNDADGNSYNLTVTGPEYVAIGSTNTYTLVIRNGAGDAVSVTASDVTWSIPDGFSVNPAGASLNVVSISLVASTSPSSNVNDQEIECQYDKSGWKSTDQNGNYTIGGCGAQKDVTIVQLEFINLTSTYQYSYQIGAFTGETDGDGLGADFKAACVGFKDAADNLDENGDISLENLEGIQDDFEAECQSILEDLGKLPQFALNDPTYNSLTGNGALAVRCRPAGLGQGTLTQEVKEGDWQSTASFGNSIINNLQPTSFQSGSDTSVSYAFTGNYGTETITASICGISTELRIAAEGGPIESRVVIEVLQRYNENKSRYNDALDDISDGAQICDYGKNILSIIFGEIPGAGAVISAIDNVKIATIYALTQLYNEKLQKNLDQAKRNIIEAEQFPDDAPLGGTDDPTDRIEQAEMLDATN